MDWDNLKILAIISEEGSLAGTARALGVNHATISRRLAALEDYYGCALVKRLTRSTPLTKKGEEIATFAREMQVNVQKIERLVNLSEETITGSVKLSAPPAFLSETLIPELKSIGHSFPDLQLVFIADTQALSLDDGEADIAVRLIEPKSMQNIVRKLGTISYSLYGTNDYVSKPSNAWHFAGFESDLANTPQQKWLIDFAAGRPINIVSNSFYVQKAAAEADLCLAVLPDKIAKQSIKLVRVSDQAPPERTAWLVIQQDIKNAPAVRIVVDAIIKAFQQ